MNTYEQGVNLEHQVIESLPGEMASSYVQHPRVYTQDGTYVGQDLAKSTELTAPEIVTSGTIGGILFETKSDSNVILPIAGFVIGAILHVSAQTGLKQLTSDLLAKRNKSPLVRRYR